MSGSCTKGVSLTFRQHAALSVLSVSVALTKDNDLGVDLQAELHTRSANQGGRDAPPLPAPAAQAPALQRAIMNRHHQARRSPTSGPLKMEPMQLSIPALRSPGHHPHSTSPSQASSSSSTSPAFGAQGVLTPPASDHAIPLRPPPMGSGVRTTSAPHAPGVPMMAGPGGPRTPGGPTRQSTFYPSPFQHHIDQLGKLARPSLFLHFRFERALPS